MRQLSKILSLAVVIAIFNTSCQKENENPNQLTDAEIAIAENETAVESAFEDIDDIAYESLFYTDAVAELLSMKIVHLLVQNAHTILRTKSLQSTLEKGAKALMAESEVAKSSLLTLIECLYQEL
jgi:putative ribosome biogenesis GTPase RsgA